MPKKASILELGCGDGSFLKDLLDDGYTNIRGVDLSTTYQYVVESELISFEYASQFVQKCPDASIDVIIALDVFEHIPYDELVNLLAIIKTRLTSKGFVIFRVPNMASPFALINYFGDVSHTTPFTELSIQQLAFNSGLRLVSVHPEPFAYPTRMSSIIRTLIWPIFKSIYVLLLAAFGINARVITPNIVCKLSN